MVWMDANESDRGLKKQLAIEKVRPHLVPVERSNGLAAHRARIREVSSRYMSTPSAAKRCPSPVSRSNTTPAPVVVPKRALSAERKRPSTPLPSRTSTPVRDIDVISATRKIALTKQPESLWPSTMRSLSVSFQSDGYPIATAKKEKPLSPSLSDRSLRTSHKQPESPLSARKATPERRKSPLKGKSLLDQSENAKPSDSSHTRLVDQHRWPSRIGGKISSGSLNRSVDFTDKMMRTSAAPLPKIGIPSLRRLSDGMSKPVQKTCSDVTNPVTSDLNILQRKGHEGDSSTDLNNLLKVTELRKPPPLNLSDRNILSTPGVRSQSLPGSRHPSPIRAASQSKVSSPSHSRPATPPRGLSPSRIRPLSASGQSSYSTSVLNFIADFRKPKKSNQLEDAHQVRLLYNRHLQWRFANARADVALRIQKVTAERSLNNVWRTNLALWDSVIKKKISLQQMRLEVKLNLILNEQLSYLDDWKSLEKDHSLSLAGVIEDLEATTLRLPLTGGARADAESLKVAIGSAMDVMQSMGPSVITLLSRVEGVNSLVSRLADLAVQERAVLDECEALLALNASMQVEENSLRTHLIQTYASIDRY
uniref:AUGMIN subunit 8 n=1 Tax=Kalanchoe fedtschenkoi TaxID=63787 RepID=A0A7N0V7G6_KALFE